MTDDHLAFQRSYRKATGFTAADKRQAAALERAHKLRQFEIDNYWKRSTYFWAFQAVAFGALAWTFSSKTPSLLLPVCLLGGLTSLAGCLTARGSKFWQENWEAHVDMLENKYEGALHKTIVTAKPRSFSVSTVNERLLDIFCVAWLLCFLTALVSLSWWGKPFSKEMTDCLMAVGTCLFALVATLYLTCGARSKLYGNDWKAPYDKPEPVTGPTKSHQKFIIRRE